MTFELKPLEVRDRFRVDDIEPHRAVIRVMAQPLANDCHTNIADAMLALVAPVEALYQTHMDEALFWMMMQLAERFGFQSHEADGQMIPGGVDIQRVLSERMTLGDVMTDVFSALERPLPGDLVAWLRDRASSIPDAA